MDGWIGLSGCGKWMWRVESECGKWIVDLKSGAVPDLTYVVVRPSVVCPSRSELSQLIVQILGTSRS